MTMTDPVADMLTRIRNGQSAHKAVVSSPSSKMRKAVLDVLQREGYIIGYEEREVRTGISEIDIHLKYYNGEPVIKMVKRISKPGRRVYNAASDIAKVANGLGIAVVSTPNGLLTDTEAREQNVGGEIICTVY